MTRSRLKNRSNWIAYKKQRNKCTKLRSKSIKSYFFRRKLRRISCPIKLLGKPFLSNKGTHDKHDIMLQENGSLIIEKGKVSEILNDFYVNIAEHTTGMSAQTCDCSNRCTIDKKKTKLSIISESIPVFLKLKKDTRIQNSLPYP